MKLGSMFFAGLVRRHPYRWLLIVFCTMCCFCGQLGLQWADHTVLEAQKCFWEQCGTGDIVVYSETVEKGALETMLLDIPGVAQAAEGVISEPVRCSCKDGKMRSVRFYTFLSEKLVKPVIEGMGSYALSYAYTAEFEKEAVAEIVLPDKEKLQIQAVAYMPLFTGSYINHFVPETEGDLVDLYVSPEELERLTGENEVNYAVAEVEDPKETNRILKDIRNNSEIFISYAAVSENEPGFAASLALGEIVHRICSLFPWIFMGVGLVFICIFLWGTAGKCADSIKRLFADGASGFAILTGFYLFGLTGMLAGFVAISPICAAVADYIADVSLKNMGVPYAKVCLAPKFVLFGLIACLVISFLAAGMILLIVVRPGVEKITGVRKRRETVWGRILVTGITTAIAIYMSGASFLFLDSLDAIREEQFQDRYSYDVQVVYSGFVPVTQLKELEESGLTEACEPMLFGNMRISYGEAFSDAAGVGLSGEPLLIIPDETGEPVEIKGNGIILSEKTAEEIGIVPGDVVQVQISYGNTGITAFCKVTGISPQSSAFLEAVSIDTVEEYMNSSGVMNSAAVKVKEGCLEEFVTDTREASDVIAVQTGRGAQQRFDSRYQGTRVLVFCVILVSVLLGLSVCLLMCYIQWKQDQKRNIIFTALGAHPLWILWRGGRIRLCGLIPGGLVGYFVCVKTMPQILDFLSTDTVRYPFVISSGTVFAMVFLGIGYEVCCQGMYFVLQKPRG